MKQSRRFDHSDLGAALVPLAAAVLSTRGCPRPSRRTGASTARRTGTAEGIHLLHGRAPGGAQLLGGTPHLDPRGKSYSRFARPYRAMRVVLALFCIGLTGMQAAAAWPGAQVNTAGFLDGGDGPWCWAAVRQLHAEDPPELHVAASARRGRSQARTCGAKRTHGRAVWWRAACAMALGGRLRAARCSAL